MLTGSCDFVPSPVRGLFGRSFVLSIFLLVVGAWTQAQGASIALVQHAGKDAGTTTSSTLAFTSANTAGNWIAILIRGGSSSSQVFTVADSNGNTYRQATKLGFSGSAVTMAIYYAENIKAGANTVTVSDTVSGPLRFAILEYSGVATSSSLDVAVSATGVSTSPNSGNLTTTANGDLLLAAVGTNGSATYTAGSSYTIRDFVPAEPSTKLISEDQIQAAAGLASAGATIVNSDNWGVVLIAIKPAGGVVGAPASVTATAGTPQSATVNTAFGTALQATVKDSFNNPVGGVVVTFTAPGSGASGTFAGGANTATTNASGVATSSTFTANATAGGPYNVVASATGATSANFALTNTAGSAAKVNVTSGSGQSAPINTAFGAPLVVTVTDASNNPVGGVVVTFTAPGSGASGTFAGGANTATTNGSGVATSATFTANSAAGGPYSVVASATGATSANFSLTNTAGAAAKVTLTSGSGQSATISTAFGASLVVTVTDVGNNPVSGVVVTFTAPGSGASGTFANGTATTTATTNGSGVATSSTFTANATAGGPYNVVASATGATSANFALTNTAGAAAKVSVTSGSGQSAPINTAFSGALVATVTDAGNNPVSGVVVTFTAPGSGASGTFANGTAATTATTNGSGVATSSTFTANGTAGGAYNVVASATGATSANFSLTNTSAVPAKVSVTSGSGQSSSINTAFGAPLVVTVTDASNNPVSGVVVTFTAPGSGASGTFAGGANTATTNGSGVATSSTFTANGTAGGPYNVVASATGATSANFALTNTTGPAANVLVTSGSGQSAVINTAFGAPLVATVTDAGNNPVSGVVVTFTAPGSGASGTFANGTATTTATTNGSGVATSSTFTANATAGGPYNVVASATGATSANFALTNSSSAPANITLIQHTNRDAGTTTSATLAFTSANTAGNWIAVVIRAGGSSAQVFAVSDSNHNTYRQAFQLGTSADAITLAVYYAENINGGANTVTVSDTVSGPLRFAILEYSGVATSSSLDLATTNQGLSTSPDSGSLSTSANGDLLLGGVVTNASATVTAGTGYAIEEFVPAEPSTKLIAEDQIQVTAGLASAGATLAASDNWGAGLAAFKSAVASNAPRITSLSQTLGAIGTPITITGINFGSTPGSVTFNNTSATPSSWSNTSIVVPVPSGATTGNVLVTVGGVLSNGMMFTVTSAPTITNLSPNAGPVGTSVTISGANFGNSTGTLSFNNTPATPSTWSDTSIVALVPNGATTGNVVVVTAGSVASNAVNFSVVTSGNISLIQHRSLDGGPLTGSLAFLSPNTAGNFIAVAVRGGNSNAQAFTVSDSNGNTYFQAYRLGLSAAQDTFALYYAENIQGGANTITVSMNVSGPLRFAILEYSGVATSNPLDATTTGQGSGTSLNSGNLTTSANGDLLFGQLVTNSGQAYTAGAGYNMEESVPTEPASKLVVEDQLQAKAGSASANATIAASDNWGAGLAAFRSITGVLLPINVSVSPSTVSVPSGYGTQTFTATVNNDFLNRGVNWSLSGVGCSGSACGTLSNVSSTSATYTAPPNIPNPATVTVTATAVGDNTRSDSATITIVQGVLTIVVSPRRAAITMSASQTVQFTDTVFNDPSNSGVTWQVDGNNSGNATTGTISGAGLFTPGTQAGQHTVTAVSNANASVSVSVMVAVTDLTGVFMHHNDVGRTGQNLNEYGLTAATVTPSTFGQLFSCPVDGYVYAQPLWVANLNFAGAVHNVVFVSTQHDSVYAFDADSPSCVQLWHVSFLGTGVTTLSPSDLQGNTDISPEVGITSTPVIDPSTNTLYVTPKTRETVGTVNGQACSTSSPCYVYRLHALDLISGAEKFGGPAVISASGFTAHWQLQRPALLLANGTIYLAFGSHGDLCPYWGFVMGYNPSTLAQVFSRSLTNFNTGCNLGGIWGGGAGPSADASGNIYVSTGNGTYDGSTNWGDSAVKLSPTGSVLDWFTPFNQSVFDANDIDLGSGGILILPDSVGSAAHQHLAIATGKVAILYLLDQSNMGKFNSNTNNDVQEVIPVAPPNTTMADGGNYGDPAYWNGNIYSTGQSFPLSQFQISNGTISAPQFAQSSITFPPRGGMPIVSANGNTGGIVWIIDYSGANSGAASILDAYDATNVGTLLYSSPVSGSGAAGPAVKFTTPMAANGKVYVGSQNSVTVFGLLP